MTERIKLVKNRSTFWCEWELKQKRLKQIEPKCNCKKGDPEHGYHSATCPYLTFWNKEFLRFQQDWKPPKTLENFITNTKYKDRQGV